MRGIRSINQSAIQHALLARHRRHGQSSGIVMSPAQLKQLELWQPWIFVGFWLAQTSTLFVPSIWLFFGFAERMIGPKEELRQHWLNKFTGFEIYAIPITIVLQAVEMGAYRQGRLRPIFYLGSQVFKSIAPTWEMYRHLRLRHVRPDVVKELTHISAFWGALAYAIYVLILNLRARRRRSAVSEEMQGILPPEEINATSNLRANSPPLFKLVRWLNQDTPSNAVLQQPLETFVKWAIFIAKYVVSAIPMTLAVRDILLSYQ
jgi:hypothetical protein